MTEHDQLDPEGRSQLEANEAAYAQWKTDLAATIDRFAVDDFRPDDVVNAELDLARRILKQRAPKKKKKKRGRRTFGVSAKREGVGVQT